MRTSILKSNEATSLRTNASTAVPFRCRLIGILCAGVQISLSCRQLQEMVEFTCCDFIFTPHKFRNCTRLLWIHVCRHADNAESKCVQDEPGFATMRFITWSPPSTAIVSFAHRFTPASHSTLSSQVQLTTAFSSRLATFFVLGLLLECSLRTRVQGSCKSVKHKLDMLVLISDCRNACLGRAPPSAQEASCFTTARQMRDAQDKHHAQMPDHLLVKIGSASSRM